MGCDTAAPTATVAPIAPTATTAPVSTEATATAALLALAATYYHPLLASRSDRG